MADSTCSGRDQRSIGTYNPDGTVNMETARRLGWDKEWEKRGITGAAAGRIAAAVRANGAAAPAAAFVFLRE
jgi:hypothetical protein